MNAATGVIQIQIENKLRDALSPEYLEIVNESYKHNVPKGSESHFKVTIVSPAFIGKSLIERHRMVNSCVAEELKNNIHALSIQAKTPEQWSQNPTIHSTPNCAGGHK